MNSNLKNNYNLMFKENILYKFIPKNLSNNGYLARMTYKALSVRWDNENWDNILNKNGKELSSDQKKHLYNKIINSCLLPKVVNESEMIKIKNIHAEKCRYRILYSIVLDGYIITSILSMIDYKSSYEIIIANNNNQIVYKSDNIFAREMVHYFMEQAEKVK